MKNLKIHHGHVCFTLYATPLGLQKNIFCQAGLIPRIRMGKSDQEYGDLYKETKRIPSLPPVRGSPY